MNIILAFSQSNPPRWELSNFVFITKMLPPMRYQTQNSITQILMRFRNYQMYGAAII